MPPLKSWEGHVTSPFSRFLSIHRCFTQAGPPVPPTQKVWRDTCPLLNSADPHWHVINSEMSDTGRVTCVPPPSQTMGGARTPPPILAFNPFRDVWPRHRHLCPLLKSWEGHVCPVFADPRWLVDVWHSGSTRFHTSVVIYWLINYPEPSGVVNWRCSGWVVGFYTGIRYIRIIWIQRLLFLNVPFNDENDDYNVHD